MALYLTILGVIGLAAGGFAIYARTLFDSYLSEPKWHRIKHQNRGAAPSFDEVRARAGSAVVVLTVDLLVGAAFLALGVARSVPSLPTEVAWFASVTTALMLLCILWTWSVVARSRQLRKWLDQYYDVSDDAVSLRR